MRTCPKCGKLKYKKATKCWLCRLKDGVRKNYYKRYYSNIVKKDPIIVEKRRETARIYSANKSL